VAELCPAEAADNPIAWNKAWLAGDVLLEIGWRRAEDGAFGRDLLARARGRLAELLTLGKLAPRERAAAGDTLADLGDSRLEVMTLEGMQLCYVPAGSFWMGSEGDPLGRDNEKPLHEVDIPYDYWLGRYPVSNAQFAAFVSAGGYREPAFWPEAQAAKYWRSGKFGDRDAPSDYGRPFSLPNHPVVGVSWYEALAFCRWLSGVWREARRLPAGWSVTLPSEAEWEKAARGGLEIPAEPGIVSAGEALQSESEPSWQTNPEKQRRYPWGDTLAAEMANYKEAGIGTTCAVGSFPADTSPYSVNDMAGNVNEWTRSRWGKKLGEPDFKYPYEPGDGREELDSRDRRVVRGGSFYDDEKWPRCAYRFGVIRSTGTSASVFGWWCPHFYLWTLIPLNSDL
jgi:formylglycine-generating enzyme required for sulfatase activity